MSDTLTPALSAEAWREALSHPFGLVDWLVRPAELLGYGRNSSGDLLILLAVANAALPNDSPYKITRRDIDLIAAIGEEYLQLLRRALSRCGPVHNPRSFGYGV